MKKKYLLLFYFKDTDNSEKNNKIPLKIIICIIVATLVIVMILILAILYKFYPQIVQYITNSFRKDKSEGKQNINKLIHLHQSPELSDNLNDDRPFETESVPFY